MAEVKIDIAIGEKPGGAIQSIERKATSACATIQTRYLEMAAKVAGAWMMISTAIDYAKLGAAAQQAEASFKAVSAAYGVNADLMLGKMKEVSAGIIDDSNLMQRAVRALQQGLTESQIVQLLEVSRSSARVAGIDIASTFDRITEATANQNTRGLAALGIVIDQNKAFESYAKSLGKTKESLTELEQSQALANDAIAEGKRQMEAMGEITENATERIQKAEAQLRQLKDTIGKGINIALQAMAGAALYAVGALFKVIEACAKLDEIHGKLGAMNPLNTQEQQKGWRAWAEQSSINAVAARDTAAEYFKKAKTLFKGIAATEEATTKEKGFMSAQAAAAAAAEKEKQAITASTKALQDMSKVISSTHAETLKLAGEEFSTAIGRNETSIDGMKSALEDYGKTLSSVYQAQIQAQKEIESAMGKAGAEPAAVAAQGIAVLEAEKSLASARLGMWQQYYSALSQSHAQATEKMKQKTQELKVFEDSIMQQKRGYSDLMDGLRQKNMTDEEKSYDQLSILSEKYQYAMALDGEERINALSEWQGLRASTLGKGEGTEISSAMQDIATAQATIESDQAAVLQSRESELNILKQYIGQLDLAKDKALEMVEAYKSALVDVDNSLAAQRMLSIDTSQAVDAAREVKRIIDEIPERTVKTIEIQYVTKGAA